MTSDSGKDLPFTLVQVGKVPFAATNLTEAVGWLVDQAVPARVGVNIRLANAYNVALVTENEDYAQTMCRAGLNFPDGAPVVWFMRLRNRQCHAGRVRGPSFFAESLARDSTAKHFFLGSTAQTLEGLVKEIHTRFPHVSVAGVYSPPFAPVDDQFINECVEQILESNPDVVWLGLGTPKQDVVGTELSARLGLPVVNVGAAFDFMAGNVREAPRWVQRSGFEWAYRLIAEPRRLWKRYLFGNTRFLVAASIDLLSAHRPQSRDSEANQ